MPIDKTFGTTDIDVLDTALKALLPAYDETSNAPAEAGSIIHITGNGSDPAGMYVYNGSAWVGPVGTGSGGTDTRTDLSDSGGIVVGDTQDITFTDSGDATVSVTSDGDGTGTVDISATDTDTTDHTQLTNVQADQHHTKTTAAADLTDVSADSVADAHHTKTTSASELSDVSADSVADAHHARYTDDEARAAGKTGPLRIHSLYTSWTDLAGGSATTVGSRNTAGRALAYYCGTKGGAPPIANDLNWRFYYDGESTPTFDMITIGDALGPSGAEVSQRNQGAHWSNDADDNAFSWVVFEDPAPYGSSVDVELANDQSTNSPEGYAMAFVADDLDIPAIGDYRRHATGAEDDIVSDGATQTLVSVTSTRGRLYGVWIDADGQSTYDVEVQVTMDGEGTPSLTINTQQLIELFRGYETAGSGLFGIGEYTNADGQVSWYFTPGALGYYSDFASSMTIDLVNNGGSNLDLDWCVAWDESV